jgi:hypothetical protein
MTNNRPGLTVALQQWLEAQHGLGLILFVWVVFLSLLGGVVLLLIGIMLWNPWLFLSGLFSLRLFAYAVHVGAEILQRLFPGG